MACSGPLGEALVSFVRKHLDFAADMHMMGAQTSRLTCQRGLLWTLRWSSSALRGSPTGRTRSPTRKYGMQARLAPPIAKAG